MGNEQSQSKSLNVDTKSMTVCDQWSIYPGNISENNDSQTLISIFQYNSINTSDTFWTNENCLERASKVFFFTIFDKHEMLLKKKKQFFLYFFSEEFNDLSSSGNFKVYKFVRKRFKKMFNHRTM